MRRVRRNPGYDFDNLPYEVTEAAFLAQYYHGGMWSALYRLSSADWEDLDDEDFDEAADEFEDVLSWARDDSEIPETEVYTIEEAVPALRKVAKDMRKAAKKNPRKKTQNPRRRARRNPEKVVASVSSRGGKHQLRLLRGKFGYRIEGLVGGESQSSKNLGDANKSTAAQAFNRDIYEYRLYNDQRLAYNVKDPEGLIRSDVLEYAKTGRVNGAKKRNPMSDYLPAYAYDEETAYHDHHGYAWTLYGARGRTAIFHNKREALDWADQFLSRGEHFSLEGPRGRLEEYTKS